LRMAWEISVVAEILTAAEEKHLDAGLPALLVERDDVGIAERLDIDLLVGGHMGEGADTVAVEGGAFEIHRLAGRFHLLRQSFLDRPALAAQEALSLGDQPGIVLDRNTADTGCGATLDLVQQARPRPRVEDGIRTGAQQKSA